uniref:Uncharacterized protein n=1 Tax=Daphnia galeata TaxID=27404 RepID=A0A8J2S186_9CRUS|nr:unnamed protein product [Daphnia galeata]
MSPVQPRVPPSDIKSEVVAINCGVTLYIASNPFALLLLVVSIVFKKVQQLLLPPLAPLAHHLFLGMLLRCWTDDPVRLVGSRSSTIVPSTRFTHLQVTSTSTGA